MKTPCADSQNLPANTKQQIHQGFIIPVYRHGAALSHVIDKLKEYNLPIIVIDDGNGGEEKELVAQTVRSNSLCTLVVRDKNGGKGKSVIDGVLKAREIGLTHVLQIDADGQHDTKQCALFFAESSAHPEAVICGYPEYDESAPSKRKNGRIVANIWTDVVSCSRGIKDAMCGFRVYPVELFCKLISQHHVAPRMGFDIDIIVRFAWKGVSVRSFPVHVSYPEDGVSNFRMVKDNVDISFLFARLCLGMIVRLPYFGLRAAAHTVGARTAQHS
jgi:glycosyltransferase involved in cell wall biosynthesis